ncbi:MAG: hypothetical protein KGJ02_07825 [Verrucomicrobiota bacterium]|nr:hypothetical protein [Verrucomicrobiota bacterium]
MNYPDLPLEEQVKLYKELAQKINEMEEHKKALGQLIVQQMTIPKMQIGSYRVCSYTRVSVKTPLEEARRWNAIEMVETVDKEKIKALHKLGHPVSGISESQYITVSPMKGSE